jgi:hypothetical protein
MARKRAREDREPSASDALGVHLVEGVEMLHAEFPVEAELGSLTRHPPLLAGDSRHVLLGVG